MYRACWSGNVANLDLVEYLLENGADPNAQDPFWPNATPLMCTIPHAPSVAKFLLNWPITDANITSSPGVYFQALFRCNVDAFPDNPDQQIQHQFLLQQWREIEEMLVERGVAAG
jgi:hypothetical protein